MRKALRFSLLVTLVVAGTFGGRGALDAQVAIRAVDDSAEWSRSGPALAPRADEPAEVLYAPFFLVNRTDPAGTTTLVAVRNITSASVDLEIQYRSQSGDLLEEERVDLSAEATFTRNLRDVAGLPATADGFARGFVEIARVDAPRGAESPSLVGDVLQVDVGGDFATGDRLVSNQELCEEQEARFFDFGAGTTFRILIRTPRGGTLDDPPSVGVRIVDEDGVTLRRFRIHTDLHSFAISSSSFTSERFGTMIFDFLNSGGGYAYAESSAEGRFSVGLNSACRVFSSL